ncbi:MAG: NAD+ synthase [Acidobacteriota bacterium]|nr:NAD+ synthase [Acidobacteriota bacterium]
MHIRLALAQINARVGDLRGNRDKILAGVAEARQKDANLVVFPEMAITGYPPEDLLLKPDFIEAANRILQEIAAEARGLIVIVGTVEAERDLYNAAAVLHNGHIVAYYRKQRLPNYGVFDENRYFQFGRQRLVFETEGSRFAVNICEDIWYPDGPPAQQSYFGEADLLINISASPYHMGKGRQREQMLATRAIDMTSIVAYCNLVGGQDELVFDGQSVIIGPQGEVIARGRQFEEQLLVADLDFRAVLLRRLSDPRRRKTYTGGQRKAFDQISLNGESAPRRKRVMASVALPLEPLAEVYEALVTAVRDYVRKNGFRDVVLGLSGGVDSALTAAIAVDALGPSNVTAVLMPTRFSSSHSLEDARSLAQNLRIKHLTAPIDDTFQSFIDVLTPLLGAMPAGLTAENLQPRIRGTLLMALSNQSGSLVLTTGNKSEVGVGYSTLYGDTAGGFAVLKDVQKTLVYGLCQYRNERAGYSLIPQQILTKAPSAELRPEQKDSDSLPEYSVLDPILKAYVEDNYSPAEMIEKGFDCGAVHRTVGLIDRNEYKRRQSPPGVKITPRAFGKDWRLPITNAYFSAGACGREKDIDGPRTAPERSHPSIPERAPDPKALSENGARKT